MGYSWLVKFGYIIIYAIKISTSFALFTKHDLTCYITFRVSAAQKVPPWLYHPPWLYPYWAIPLQEHTLPAGTVDKWIALGNGQWTADGYLIITVYLHKTPVYPSPWNIAYYVIITGGPSVAKYDRGQPLSYGELEGTCWAGLTRKVM